MSLSVQCFDNHCLEDQRAFGSPTLICPKRTLLEPMLSFRLETSGSCFDYESHDKDCNRDGATEVGNVRVESFHAASAGYRSLLFFLWAMAKA